jgi:membrane protein involved in colicin uptake
MPAVFDFKKLRRLIKIYAVVQVVLVALLVFVAMNFQAGLAGMGRGELFMKSIIITAQLTTNILFIDRTSFYW